MGPSPPIPIKVSPPEATGDPLVKQPKSGACHLPWDETTKDVPGSHFVSSKRLPNIRERRSFPPPFLPADIKPPHFYRPPLDGLQV